MSVKNWSVIIKKSPCGCYTEGLSEYGSLEIEIAVPMKIAEYEVLCVAVKEAVEKGLKIEDGVLYYDFYTSPIFFFKVKSLYTDKEVFRAIVMDEKGFFPWDMRSGIFCDEPYKSQITFEHPKVFLVEILKKSIVEEFGTGILSPFSHYTKEDGIYTTAIQYYLPQYNDLITISPFSIISTSNAVLGVLNDMVICEVDRKDIRVICKDVDFTKKINKGFEQFYKENYDV